jgi:hypothetical protein
MFMLEPPDGDALAAGAEAAPDGELAGEAATAAAVLVALPWQAAVPMRPATDTVATTALTAVRGQAERITGSSLAGAHRVSYGPPGRLKP